MDSSTISNVSDVVFAFQLCHGLSVFQIVTHQALVIVFNYKSAFSFALIRHKFIDSFPYKNINKSFKIELWKWVSALEPTKTLICRSNIIFQIICRLHFSMPKLKYKPLASVYWYLLLQYATYFYAVWFIRISRKYCGFR